MNCYNIIILMIVITRTFPDSDNSESKFNEESNPSLTCYAEIGCLKTDSTWFHREKRPKNLVPQDRITIKTDFLVLKKNTSTSRDMSDLYYTSAAAKAQSIQAAGFKAGKPIMFLIHDYTSNGYTGWIKHLTMTVLIKHKEYNIISVDWQQGAKFPYFQAIANARVVGLEIIHFIKELKDSMKVNLNDIHIVGHGVGSHIAGYVGANFSSIGKISGLDPSGPGFEGMPDIVKLNPSRAKYVEVLHTDAFDVHSQGTLEKMGHSDFYINNAALQPGCPKNSVSNTATNVTLADGEILPGCSHKRSFKYFIEAIGSGDCTFFGIECDSFAEFITGSCTSCGKSGDQCRTFGLGTYSDEDENVSFYLNTKEDPPFCMFQYKITVKLANTGGSYFGYFDYILVDSKRKVVHASLSGKNYTKYKSGAKATSIYYAPPPLLSKLIEAKVRWMEEVKFYCAFYCKQSVIVEAVYVTSLGVDKNHKSYSSNMCPPKGQRTVEIQNGNYITFLPCNED